MPRLQKVKRSEADDFIRRLCLLKVEAGKVGLYATMQEMESAVKKVGWELAYLIERGDVTP